MSRLTAFQALVLALLAALLLALPVTAAAETTAAQSATAAAAALVVAVAVVIAVVGLVVSITFWGVRRRREVGAAAEATALETALARAHAVLASFPEGYYEWGPDGRERCSRRLAAQLGIAATEVAGFADLGRHFASASFAALQDAVAALRQDDQPFSLGLEAAEAGRRFTVRGTATPLGGSVAHVLWFDDASRPAPGEAFGPVAGGAIATGPKTSAGEGPHDVNETSPLPSWRRAADLSLVWVNSAYLSAVEASREAALAHPGLELDPDPGGSRALAERAASERRIQIEQRRFVVAGERRTYDLIELPLADGGSAGFARNVTDREDLANELARHLDAQAELLDQLQSAIAIFGPDKRLRFFNHAFARLWELDADWLEARPGHDEILEMLRERRRLPEQADFPVYKAGILDLYTSLLAAQEEQIYLPDGRTLRVVVAPHPFGGLMFIYEDVSDQLELERSRNTLAAVQRATLNHLFEGVAVYGGDGRLKLHNSGFARIWQLDDEFLANEPHVSEVAEASRALLWAGSGAEENWAQVKERIVHRVFDREPRSERLELPDAVVVQFAAMPLPDGAMLHTYLDITDLSRIERALRERAEALEEADRLKTEFIATVSYELRTPLNTIIGFNEILANEYYGALNDQQRDYVRGTLYSSESLLALINDILDLATIEAGQMVLELSRFDLHGVLLEVLKLVEQRMQNAGLELEFDWPPEIGQLEADQRRLKQVVFNLLSNAIKFSSRGATVTLGARRHGGEIDIWVADTGEGIPLEQHEWVFEKFTKGQTTTARNPGAGLGLSLVLSFVELHGGVVELQSTPGAGTRVTCRLPVEGSAAPRR
jgi:signal transduction histidine kinase